MEGVWKKRQESDMRRGNADDSSWVAGSVSVVHVSLEACGARIFLRCMIGQPLSHHSRWSVYTDQVNMDWPQIGDKWWMKIVSIGRE